MILTADPDVIAAIDRALIAGCRVDIFRAPYIAANGDEDGDEWLPTVRIDGYYLPGSPADLDKWLGLEVVG